MRINQGVGRKRLRVVANNGKLYDTTKANLDVYKRAGDEGGTGVIGTGVIASVL